MSFNHNCPSALAPVQTMRFQICIFPVSMGDDGHPESSIPDHLPSTIHVIGYGIFTDQSNPALSRLMVGLCHCLFFFFSFFSQSRPTQLPRSTRHRYSSSKGSPGNATRSFATCNEALIVYNSSGALVERVEHSRSGCSVPNGALLTRRRLVGRLVPNH